MDLRFNMDLRGFDTLERDTISNARKVLFFSMNKMEELAKRRVPVDTGRLRMSINLSPRFMGSDSYTLADGVHYGVYVEYGTSRMIAAHGIHDPENPITTWEALRKRNGRGQTMPFMRPAMLEVKRVWVPKFWNRFMGSS